MNIASVVRVALTATVFAIVGVMPGVAQTVSTGSESVSVVYVPTGESTVIPAGNVTRLAIGNSSIAGVIMAGNNSVLVNGKNHGRTTLFIWHGATRSTYLVEVIDQSLGDYARVLRAAIDEAHVVVDVTKGAIVISGNVVDVQRFSRLEDVVNRFSALSKHQNFDIVNTVTVAQQLGSLQAQLAKTPGLESVAVDLDGKGNVVVSGTVRDRRTAELALQRAGGIAGAYLSADGKVIDRITTDRTTQIGVKVYVLEIDNTGLSQLGIRLQGANPDPTNPGAFTYGNPSFIGVENQPNSPLNIAPFSRITRLAPTLDAILQTGHAKILSEPNLVTTPGMPATFLVGGQIPYAYSAGLGQVSIVFKDYGVKLEMTPKILGNGDIETLIAPEVSDLDFTDGIQSNGFVVPALKTSKLSTDIITEPGESVVMGGLLRRIETRNIYRFPILGDLPIIGKLFRSTQYQTSQTDVVFVMTPESIVR